MPNLIWNPKDNGVVRINFDRAIDLADKNNVDGYQKLWLYLQMHPGLMSGMARSKFSPKRKMGWYDYFHTMVRHATEHDIYIGVAEPEGKLHQNKATRGAISNYLQPTARLYFIACAAVRPGNTRVWCMHGSFSYRVWLKWRSEDDQGWRAHFQVMKQEIEGD